MGRMIKVLLLATMTSLSMAATCTPKRTEFTMYATVGEQQEWDMQSQFFDGEDLTFSLSDPDQGQFSVKQPIMAVGASVPHYDVSLVKGFKPYRQYQNGVWLNRFIFMEQDTTSVDIFYSEAYPQETNEVPSFSTFVNVQTDIVNLECYDLDYLTANIFLADCSHVNEEGILMNGFITVDSTKPEPEPQNYANENPRGYKVVHDRKIIINDFYYQLGENGEQVGEPIEVKGEIQAGSTQKLLIRSAPCYAVDGADITKNPPVLDTDSEIEVFRFEGVAPVETPKLLLTKDILAGLLGVSKETFKFSLVDFQVEPNGYIYILDALNGIYVVTINAGGEWVFKDHISDPFASYMYAFDFNNLLMPDGSYEKHLVIVYQKVMNTFVNGVMQNQYTLKQAASYGYTQVFLSQQYIVYRHMKQISLYSSQESLLIHTAPMEEADVVLVNPYEPDMLGLSQYASHRYLISNGFLKWMTQVGSTTDLKSIDVIATDSAKQSCKVNIHYRILEKSDSKLYDLSHNPIPSVLKYPEDPVLIDLMASGPNLKYVPITPDVDGVVLGVRSAWNLKLTGINLPNAKDVYFSDILSFDDQVRFYLLLQTNTKVVYIYQCEHQIQQQEVAVCKDQDSFSLQVLLNKKTHSFSWWTQYAQITYLFQTSDYQISLYVSVYGKSQLVDTISYEDTPENKITSFIYLGNVIYVVQEARETIDIWSNTFPIQKLYSITRDLVVSQGFDQNFNPKRVFGNKKIKSQLVFIQTGNRVIMGTYAKAFTTLMIQDIMAGAEIEIAIGDKTFFIAQKNGQMSQAIDEYNYAHLQNIYKTQALPLYHYRFQEPFTVDYCAQSGWIFVRALDTITQKTVILLYEPNVLNHISLHKVLETQELIAEGSTFDMAVDGNQQMFLYFNDNKMHTVVAILQDAELTFTPTRESPKFVNKVRGGVQISNFGANPSKDIVRDITILNTQSEVQVIQQVFDKQNKVISFKKDNAEQTIKLGTDWYHGQATDMFVDCNQCHEHVKLQTPIYSVTTGAELKAYDISDAQLFGSTTNIIYQTRDSLIFTDQAGVFKKRVDLKAQLTGKNMYLVTTNTEATLTFSQWITNDGKTNGVFVTQCTGFECTPLKQGSADFTGVTTVPKIKLIDNKFLAVLNSNPFNFLSYSGSIIIYQFQNTDPNKFELVNAKTISANTFQIATFYPADFDVIEFKVGGTLYYKILITDLKKGLAFADAYIDGTGTLTVTNHQQFSLTTYNNDQYWIDANTQFLGIKVLEQEVSGTTLKAKVLVTTSNSAQYVFGLNFNINNPATGSPLDTATVMLYYVLTPYGDWTAVDKVAYVNGYIAIPYTNQYQVTIGVYPIPTTTGGAAATVPFIYGITADYHMPLPGDFALLLTKEGETPYLWTNIVYSDVDMEHLVIKYMIQDQPTLVVTDGATLDDQTVKLHIENVFSVSTGSVKMTSSGIKPDDPGNKGSSNWWWITLIVVFGVAALGGAGFFLYKKYAKSNVDPLLG